MSSKKNDFSRRQILGGAAAVAGALAGSRIAGGGSSIIPSAFAQSVAGDKSAVVLLYMDGGYNALFSSPDSFVGAGTFGVTNNNMEALANGLVIDRATYGTLPAIAKQNMACIGVRHGITDHGAATRSNLTFNNNAAALALAGAIGGTASIKAAVVGNQNLAGPQNAVNGVSYQRITDLSSTIAALGGASGDTVPDREITAKALAAAEKISTSDNKGSPETLRTLAEGYPAAVETARAAPKPFNYAELAQAYGVAANNTTVDSFTKQMMAAELMILTGTNFVAARNNGWDTHGDRAGGTVRNRMNQQIIPGLRTFLTRMLAMPGYNVTVAIIGDFARSLPGSDHAAALNSTVWGKNVRVGTTGKVSANVGLPAGSPGPTGFWSYLAALSKVSNNPFGANPHNLIK